MTRARDLKRIDSAQLVRRTDVPWLLWGDETSGFVSDLIHVASEQILLAGIRMPPGARFESSDANKPVYSSDACLYVLKGQYTVQLPDTGEVQVAEEGEMIFLQGPQWHFGHNFTDRELCVLEAISPPPGAVPSDKQARPNPALGLDVQGLRDFPRSRSAGESRLAVVGKGSARSALIGTAHKVLLRVLASTMRLSVAVFDLAGGQRSETIRCAKDATLYVERGRMHIRIAAEGLWDEMNPEDVFFIPAGTEWQVFNYGDARASLHFALAGCLASDLEIA